MKFRYDRAAKGLIHKHLGIHEWGKEPYKQKSVLYEQLVNKLLDGKPPYLMKHQHCSSSSVLLQDAIDAVIQKLFQKRNKKAQKRAAVLRAAYILIQARITIKRWFNSVSKRSPKQNNKKIIGKMVEGVEYPEFIEKLFGGKEVNVSQISPHKRGRGAGILPNRVLMIDAIRAVADKLEVLDTLLRNAYAPPHTTVLNVGA